MIILFFILSLSVFAQEGYPPEAVKIEWEKTKQAFIKNYSCFPVTVYVNGKDHEVAAGAEETLNSPNWGSWKWFPGKKGKMDEKTVTSPLKEKYVPDFGANFGQTHINEYQFSYDFSVQEGTQVFAMESGIVVRIVQRYHQAHQDKARLDEVNKVEIIQADGSLASYVHLKGQSVPVRLCETVSKGQLIGLSGHNGFSSGPHLHVDMIRPVGMGKFHSIPLKFEKFPSK